MEAIVYRWLKLLVLYDPKHFFSVKYEPKPPFAFKANKWNCRYYLPDFKVFTSRGLFYIEVKGFMDLPDQVKIHLLHRDYPWIKLRVIKPKDMDFIKKRIAELENR